MQTRESTDGPSSLMDFFMVGGKDHQESLSIMDTLIGVDLNTYLNRRTHQTDQYVGGGLIVRRGHPFTFLLLLGKSLPSACVCVCVCVCAMASCCHWCDNHSGPVVSGFLNTAACGVFSIPWIGYVGLVGGMGKGRVCT